MPNKIKTRLTKELEKKFMEAMTLHLNEYEKVMNGGKWEIESCFVCKVMTVTTGENVLHRNCLDCPLNSIMYGTTFQYVGALGGCRTYNYIEFHDRYDMTKEQAKARFTELVKHLDKIGYVYE